MNIIGEFRNFFKLIANGNPEEIKADALDPNVVLEGIDGLTKDQKETIRDAWLKVELRSKNLGIESGTTKNKFIKVERNNNEKYIPVQRNNVRENDERID